MTVRVIDARGHRCPVPSLRLQKAMQGATAGARFELLATDPMARIDVPYLMAEAGGAVISITEIDDALSIIVETGVAPTD